MGEHKTSMKLVLCLCVALFAAGALADVELVDGVVPEGLSAPEVVPEVELTEMEMDAEFEDAKASVNELLQAGKDDKACRNLAKTTAVEVNDSVAASQKAVANMPNGDQCNNEGAHLIKKAEDDKKKADKAEKDALNAVNAAKSAKINFGDYVVSSLDGKSCGYFYNTQVWKNAQNKIKNAETAYNKRKAEAQAAAKGVTAAKEEAKVLVDKCKCSSKTAIEKAIADFNAKSKAANTAAWKKSYHMICVLDAKPANQCTVPALPEVKPVPFGKGVADSCKDYFNGKPIPQTCDTGFSKNPPKPIGTYGSWSAPWMSSGQHNGQNGKRFKLIRLNSVALNDSIESEMKLVNLCRAQGLMAFGCGHVGSWDASVCPQAIAGPKNWGCNNLGQIGKHTGWKKNIVSLQTGIGRGHTLYAIESNGGVNHPNGYNSKSGGKKYHPVCAKFV